jgi:hypothetical protein
MVMNMYLHVNPWTIYYDNNMWMSKYDRNWYKTVKGLIGVNGRIIAQAVSRWLPTTAARVQNRGLVMWDLWWTKWCWGRFSLSTSLSPVNLYSTNFSTITITYHPGLVQ